MISAKMRIEELKVQKAEAEGDKEAASAAQQMADVLRDDLKAQIKKEEEREAKKDESVVNESMTVAQKFKALM